MKRNISLLESDLFMHAWNDKKLFSRLTGFDTYVSNFEFIDSDAWFDMDWFEEIISSHWNDNPDVFMKFTRHGYTAGEKLVHFCRGMNLDGNDRLSLEEIFWRSAKLLQNLTVFIPITHPLSKVIEKKVIAILSQHGVSEADMNDRLLEVSIPVKNNGPEEELMELKKIKNRMDDSSFDLEVALKRHWQKYSYLGSRDLFSAGYSPDFFRSSLHERNLDEMGITHERDSGFQFTASEQKTVNLLKEFVWFRNYRTEKFFEALFFLEPLWKKLSLSYKLGEHDLFYYLLNEVSILFTHGDRVAVEELETRKKGSALLLDDNKFFLLTGDLLKQKEVALQSAEEESSREIKGMIVCRGKVRGKVTILHNDSELEKVNEGDILVTSMTTPDYIPAMRKAAAFVTDEGGVTCHAAIVARELKKPCIVGTKKATQLLKDGDLVEVDADMGYVRILS
ncbi:MAG: PEP-utilizing enzyme [bacterium]